MYTANQLSGSGVPTFRLLTDTSCQINGSVRLEIKCTINAMYWNHPPFPSLWKNYCPQNWSLVLKRLGTTSLVYSQLLLFAITCPQPLTWYLWLLWICSFFCWCWFKKHLCCLKASDHLSQNRYCSKYMVIGNYEKTGCTHFKGKGKCFSYGLWNQSLKFFPLRQAIFISALV